MSARAGTARRVQGAHGRTRRSFIGGVVATGASGAFAQPLFAAALEKRKCAPAPPGIPAVAVAATSDGRTIWTADGRSTAITAHHGRNLARARSIEVGGAPIAIALAPGGEMALVTTAFYDRPGLALVDLRTHQVERLDVGPEPRAVAFAPDGRSAYVAGGGSDGTLTRVDLRERRVHDPLPIGSHPHGLAITGDGSRALVALNGAAALALVELRRAQRVHHIETTAFPHELAIAPGGTRALVTHNGYGDAAVSVVDLERRRVGALRRTGRDPGGVGFSPTGLCALVACTGSAAVAVHDGHSGRRLRTVKTGGAPRAVTFARLGGVVADRHDGRLTKVRVK